ncbi:MAG: hypothetical protein IPJ41_07170 [Phycisphaerales bacterium]|nr:hypothetical protein [Phycisphaerales bacterium]
MNVAEKNYNEGRSNTASHGIAFEGEANAGDRVGGVWDWLTDAVYEIPMGPDDTDVGVLGLAGPEDSYGAVYKRRLGRIEPVLWDRSGGGVGVAIELTNPFGAQGWATSVSSDGRVTGGALYGDLDGFGVSRHAAQWRWGPGRTAARPGGHAFLRSLGYLACRRHRAGCNRRKTARPPTSPRRSRR